MTPAYSEGVGFVDLVRRHGDPLLRFAKRLVGSTDDAEEIVQEALLRAYTDRLRRSRLFVRPSQHRSKGEVAASLYRITHNLSVDYLRRRRLRLLDSEAMAHRADTRTRSPGQELELAALRSAVRQAVAELPEAHREAIALRFGLGLTYRAIARQLKASVPAIEARLHRAKLRLRKALAPWVGPVRAGTRRRRRNEGRGGQKRPRRRGSRAAVASSARQRRV